MDTFLGDVVDEKLGWAVLSDGFDYDTFFFVV